MILNYVSGDTIIAKVMSDLDIQEESQRITDMREWIFEALEKIGAVNLYDNKESNTENTPLLIINNYQTQLPDDIHSISAIAYSRTKTGPWLPMRKNTGSFKNYPDKGTVERTEAPNNINDRLFIPSVAGKNVTNYSNDLQYFIKPGHIVTNVRNGYIKIAYTSNYVDDRGYPMVPALASYLEAVYWYIVMKLKYPEYLDGRMNREIYYDIRRSWNFYCGQAYAEALMPSEGDMISIKNSWLKLVPDANMEQTFGSTIGEQEHIYTTRHRTYGSRIF